MMILYVSFVLLNIYKKGWLGEVKNRKHLESIVLMVGY